MELLAWGANSYGQLCLGYKSEQQLLPASAVTVSDENFKPCNTVSICGGAGHTLVLTKDGSVYACGWNSKGQLGTDSDTLNLAPVTELNGHKIIQIACGWDFSAAISNSGQIFVWGSNIYSQLGLPKNIKYVSKPTLLSISNVRQVSCGLRHMVIVRIDGTVIVSGQGSKGQLGLSQTEIRETTLQTVSHLNNIISTSCGQYHTLALNTDGTIFGWGNNKHGQLGINPNVSSQFSIPMKIDVEITPQQVFTGWTHTALLSTEGEVINFGRNSYGQLGDHRTQFWVPQKLRCEKIIKLSIGSEHNLAITNSNKLLCWGWNEHGNCGTGAVNNVECPEEILTKHIISYIGTGAGHSFAVVENM